MLKRFIQYFSRKKITSQFWIGTFGSQSRFYDFVAESDEFWSEENIDGDDIPLSEFIGSQGQIWYDHDFLEVGFNDNDGSVLDKFSGHSWCDKWASQVDLTMKRMNIESINVFIMMRIDTSNRKKPYHQVKSPTSYNDSDIDLHYIGVISHHE